MVGGAVAAVAPAVSATGFTSRECAPTDLSPMRWGKGFEGQRIADLCAIARRSTRQLFIRFENNRHDVTFHTSADGKTWTKFDTQMEVSGYHHNTACDLLSLRPRLYASGQGKVRFRNFR